METEKNWKMNVLLIGGLAGLATGLVAAFLIIKRRETEGLDYKINSGEGFKMGMGIVSLLKQITDIGFK
jgi:hypothetical protein